MSTLAEELAIHLPLLRRFARAITGNQEIGDSLVKHALESIVAAPASFPEGDRRLGLYRVFLDTWSSEGRGGMRVNGVDDDEAVAAARLAMLDSRSRVAFLLAEVEGFSIEDVAYLLDTEVPDVTDMLSKAREEIESQLKTVVLIIEDEPIIAMDLEGIVRDLGHDITGIAVTHDEAVAMAKENKPGLVLADIQLADNSSGIEAVQDILDSMTVPVIFITAFPERLLTGERPEPAFLITKPFQHTTVKAAIAQALFFNRETMPA